MKYVKDTELKEIPISHQDIERNRKDVVNVSCSYSGMEICIVRVVTISWEQGHSVDEKWERNTEKKP